MLAQIGGEDAVQALQEVATGLSDYDSATCARRSTPSSTVWPPSRRARMRRRGTPPKNRRRTAPRKRRRPRQPPIKKLRTWHDASGKFEIEATLVSVKDQTVTLKKKERSHGSRVAEKTQRRGPEIRPGTIAGRLRRGRDRRIGLGGAVTRRAGTSGQRMPRRRRVRWRPRRPPAGRR